jgi:hypothetical protein
MSATAVASRTLLRRLHGFGWRDQAGAWPGNNVRSDAGTIRLGVCAAATLAFLLWWGARNGGYDAVSWLEGGVALVSLAAWAWLAFGPPRAMGRRGRLALASLAVYVAWSYASVAWATDKGAAVTGSNRALLYLLLLWLFATLEWTRRRLELALTAYLLGVGALATATLVQLALGRAPQLLQGGQLAAGLGYHNATAALGTIGALGSILLGSARRARPLKRAGLAAGAAACLEVSLLAQSRGWLYTLPVIVAVVVALASSRRRAVLWATIPIGCVLASLPWVWHGPGVGSARAALLATLVCGAVALPIARLQQRYALSSRGRRLGRAVGRTMTATAAVIAVGAAVLMIGNGTVARGWHQFTTDAHVAAGVQRFAQLGSGRYDFWRVALHSVAAHPLGGLGQDNFAQTYVATRLTGEEPAWVHSLELRLLTHTGVVGFALFAAFVVFATAAARSAARASDRRVRLVLAGALVPLVVWGVHGSVDWFWEMPALSGPAFAFLGAVIAFEPKTEPGFANGWHPLVPLASVGTALVLFGSAYLGERALAAGRAVAATRPAAALRELSLAARLEPLGSAPQALQAAIELRANNNASALLLARAGLRRDPGNWVLWLEDALAAGAEGRQSAGLAALAQARALDPREPVIVLAQRRALTRHPLTINQAASLFAARAQARVAP